jgi:hypothetical protein
LHGNICAFFAVRRRIYASYWRKPGNGVALGFVHQRPDRMSDGKGKGWQDKSPASIVGPSGGLHIVFCEGKAAAEVADASDREIGSR